MHAYLHYLIAQQRLADLHRASEHRRIPRKLPTGQPTPRRSQWLVVAGVLMGAGWGSNQFPPMLLVYRHSLGLSAGALEAMFGVYALGLIPGVLLAGPVSDARGRRRPVLAAATASLVGSLLLIVGSRSPALLYVARFVVGLGSGAAFSAGTAWLRELSLSATGTAGSARAARRAVVAMTTGFAVGPLVSGLLAQWGPDGRVLPYLPHVAFMTAVVLAAARSAPETITRRTKLSIGTGLRAGGAQRRFWRSVAVVAPWVFAAPAVAFAFLPAAMGADRHTGGVVVTGALTALTALAGVLIQPAARVLDARASRWSVGTVGLLVCTTGLLLGAYAVKVSSLWLLAPCAVLLGGAYGLCLVSGLIEVGRLARPDAVGSLTATYYALAYLGLMTPYLLTLSSRAAGYPTLLLIAAALALVGAAVAASPSRRSANAAVADGDPGDLTTTTGVVRDAAAVGAE